MGKGSAVPIGRGNNRFSRGNGLASRDVLMGLNEVGQRSNDGHASLCPSYGAAALPPVEVLSTPPLLCFFYTIIPLRWIPCEPVVIPFRLSPDFLISSLIPFCTFSKACIYGICFWFSKNWYKMADVMTNSKLIIYVYIIVILTLLYCLIFNNERKA